MFLVLRFLKIKIPITKRTKLVITNRTKSQSLKKGPKKNAVAQNRMAMTPIKPN